MLLLLILLLIHVVGRVWILGSKIYAKIENVFCIQWSGCVCLVITGLYPPTSIIIHVTRNTDCLYAIQRFTDRHTCTHTHTHTHTRTHTCTHTCKHTGLKLDIISFESSISLNIPSSLLVKFGPHSEQKKKTNQSNSIFYLNTHFFLSFHNYTIFLFTPFSLPPFLSLPHLA